MAGETSRFSEFLIQDKYRYVYGVSAADIDRDGNIDLVTADIREKDGVRDSVLYWFKNDGRGKFRKHVIWQDEPGWFERSAIGDVSGNGWSDVVIVNNLLGHVIWFANNGRPAAGPWKRHVVTTNAPRAYDVVLADLDGDGKLDVAVAGYTSNTITWYKNPGESGWDKEWPRHVIDDKMSEARTVRAGDFNGNGRIDLLCTAVGAQDVPVPADPNQHGSRVVWYENPGQPASRPWTKHVIDDQSRAPIHGQPVDMTGDGKLDVVMAFGMRPELVPERMHEVAWYENLGGGRQWKKHKIGSLPCAFEAVAADLNGDGHMEVVASAWAKGDRVVWFENHGDPRGRWTMHVVKENWPAANQVIVADLTGDKRPDIIATADDGSRRVVGANELRWWRNEGRAVSTDKDRQ